MLFLDKKNAMDDADQEMSARLPPPAAFVLTRYGFAFKLDMVNGWTSIQMKPESNHD